MTTNDATQMTPHTPGGYREALNIALPLIISMGSFTLMQFVDRIFLAQHSAISIQAALPAGILSFTMSCGFMELAGYATTFVAQHHGAGNRTGCSRSVAQALILSCLSWPIILLMIPLGRWFLTIAGHAPEVMAEELMYFTILMAGGVTVPLGVAASSFFTGRGDTKTTMVANIVANAVNIVLDYVLIFGAFGFPQLGIAGAAIATVISGFISPIILLSLFFSKRYDREYETRSTFRWDGLLIKRIIRFGLPSSVHLVLDVTAFTMFVLFTGRMGATALATSNIAFSINMLAFMPLIGLSITASTLVGQYQGAEKSDIAERAGWTTFKLGLVYTAVIGATFILFPAFYYSLFTHDVEGTLALSEVLPMGRVMLLLMAIWACVDAANMIFSGALKGAGDTRFVMVYSVVMSWGVLVLGEIVIIFVLHGNILHAWGWLTFHIMVLSIGYVWRFRSGRWKTIDVLGRKTAVPPACPTPEAVVVPD